LQLEQLTYIRASQKGKLTKKPETSTFETISTLRPGTITRAPGENIARFSFYHTPDAQANLTAFETVVNTVIVSKERWHKNGTSWWADDDEKARKELVAQEPHGAGCQLSRGSRACRLLWRDYFLGGNQLGIPLLQEPPQACAPNNGRSIAFFQTCQVLAGAEVVLFYWPPERRSTKHCVVGSCPSSNTTRASKSITITEVTFRGQDLYLRPSTTMRIPDEDEDDEDDVTVSGSKTTSSKTQIPPSSSRTYFVMPTKIPVNWTFTSPTVYIAYRALTAIVSTFQSQQWYQNSRQMESTQFQGVGVFSLLPHEVSTIRPIRPDAQSVGGFQYASRVAEGKYTPVFDEFDSFETLSLDFSDLVDPVPASIYYDARSADCWGHQTHCATITDDSYRPRLFLKNEIWAKVIPKFKDCVLPPLVDPPRQIESVLGPEPDQQPVSPIFPSTTTTESFDRGQRNPLGGGTRGWKWPYGHDLEPFPGASIPAPTPQPTGRQGPPRGQWLGFIPYRDPFGDATAEDSRHYLGPGDRGPDGEFILPGTSEPKGNRWSSSNDGERGDETGEENPYRWWPPAFRGEAGKTSLSNCLWMSAAIIIFLLSI
jgi:hypothetical protein